MSFLISHTWVVVVVLLPKARSSLRLIQVLLCDKVWVVCTICYASALASCCGGLMNCILQIQGRIEAAMHLQW